MEIKYFFYVHILIYQFSKKKTIKLCVSFGFFLLENISQCQKESTLKKQKQRKAQGQREQEKLHTAHRGTSKLNLNLFPNPCSSNNNYYLKRQYFYINLKGYIFLFPSSLCGLTYPKYLHKSLVTVNMYSTIQSSISDQVRVKTEGEMSA